MHSHRRDGDGYGSRGIGIGLEWDSSDGERVGYGKNHGNGPDGDRLLSPCSFRLHQTLWQFKVTDDH